MLGGGLDRRAAGIGQAEQARHLIERFAGGIVQRGAQALILEMVRHQDQLGVAAGDDQAQQRKLRRGQVVDQPGRVQMRLEVIDAEQRQTGSEGQPLGHVQPDDE